MQNTAIGPCMNHGRHPAIVHSYKALGPRPRLFVQIPVKRHARDKRFIRLSTSPAKVAAQARTAMTINSCDSGSRDGAARIFAKWYVETEYMPNGNTPPQ